LVVAILAGGALMLTPGCDSSTVTQTIENNKPAILNLITLGASRGSQEGLKAWAAKNPAAAQEAATALSGNLDNFLAYLNGGTIGSSQEVDDLMNSSLFTNVPDEVKTAVLAASAVLDLYLPVPSATTSLSADQLDYLKAFVTGLKQGVGNFNGKAIQRTWLH
jgi:hypothetical protein